MLMAMVASLFANGLTVGADASYSKSKVSATASAGGTSVSDDYSTNTKGVELKAGYAWEEVSLTGYYLKEKYKEGSLGDEDAASFGVEAIYHTPLDEGFDFFMGGNIGKGKLDVEPNPYNLEEVKFIDIGVRAGVQKPIADQANIEVGVKIVKRTFQDLVISGVKLEMDETQLGMFVGINFNL